MKLGGFSERDIARFWSKVKVGEPGRCWEWGASVMPGEKPYGRFVWRGRVRFAHRVAYAIAHGGFDERLMVCHSCDNHRCVNPKHLWLGTGVDNIQDCIAKGRRRYAPPRGQAHPMARLTENDVREIRRLRATGVFQHELAHLFGVGQSTIQRACSRKLWRHVA